MALIPTQHLVCFDLSDPNDGGELNRRLAEAVEMYPPVRVVAMTVVQHFLGGDVYAVMVAVEEV